MNTETGQLYNAAIPGERAAMEAAVRQGAPIVPVSDAVAQKIKLGERELERRARRRKTGNIVGS